MLHKKILLSALSLFTSLSLFANISLKEESFKIYDVKNDTAKISKGNLVIGQSGVINHFTLNNRSIILANAQVINSYSDYSLIRIREFNDLKQNSIPNAKKEVSNNDTFILNFLYSSSLLITPNQESFVKVRNMFPNHNFIHSDILASFLKLEKEPYPEKELMQKFALRENIGTVFYVLDNKVYVIDSKSYKKVLEKELAYSKTLTQLPFYTRVEKIEKGTFDFSSTKYINKKDSKRTQYNNYYTNFLGL
ncbi:MAG: plasminogen-binding N-terminal domain-containing protein [Campylobacteraceae bacterium]|nr:plasminogen-binding N-terminal domain-containing protein [Campylobacteraceae bacterium]